MAVLEGTRVPTKRAVSAFVVAAIVTACSGPTASDRQGPGPTDPASASSDHPTPRATPTQDPTPQPTPEGEGELVVKQKVVIPWTLQYSDYTSYQVIIEMENVGNGWAQVSPADSDYTILGQTGRVVTTGSFTYAFPEFIPPGGVGYLIEDGSENRVGPRFFHKVEFDGRYDAVEAAEETFKIRDIALRQEDFGQGISATGLVTASDDVDDAALAVICFGIRGQLLAATWTNLLQNLTGGTRKGFETVNASPPVSPSDCVGVEGYAEDTGF